MKNDTPASAQTSARQRYLTAHRTHHEICVQACAEAAAADSLRREMEYDVEEKQRLERQAREIKNHPGWRGSQAARVAAEISLKKIELALEMLKVQREVNAALHSEHLQAMCAFGSQRDSTAPLLAQMLRELHALERMPFDEEMAAANLSDSAVARTRGVSHV